MFVEICGELDLDDLAFIIRLPMIIYTHPMAYQSQVSVSLSLCSLSLSLTHTCTHVLTYTISNELVITSTVDTQGAHT